MSGPLPTEVYLYIIHHCTRNADLLTLALCCSVFRDEAQRVLFSNPNLSSLKKQKQCVDVINSAPARLGPYVRTFYIMPVVQQPEVDLSDSAIASVLQAMFNLKRLGIYRYLPIRILKGCTFSLLSFITDTTPTLQPSDVTFLLREFLPFQKDLQHLAIIGTQYEVDEPLATVICPKLDRLCVGSISLAKALMSRDHGSIRRFQWWNRSTMPRLTIAQLNGLEYFMFYIFRRNADTSFTLHLTSLTLLELEIKMKTVDRVINQVRPLSNSTYLPDGHSRSTFS